MNLRHVFIAGVGAGMLAASLAFAEGRTHEQELCEVEGICGQVTPQPQPEPPFKYLHPALYEPFDTGIANNAAGVRANGAAIASNRAAIAQNARDIDSNTAGIAAALSLSAMQHNPNHEGPQTSFGIGYWDGEIGYGILHGHRLGERWYGNVGAVYGDKWGAVASVTLQW